MILASDVSFVTNVNKVIGLTDKLGYRKTLERNILTHREAYKSKNNNVVKMSQ